MANITLKQRIGIVLSVIWILVVLILCSLSRFRDEVLVVAYIGNGVLPVVVGWGIWWSLKERAKTKPGKDS